MISKMLFACIAIAAMCLNAAGLENISSNDSQWKFAVICDTRGDDKANIINKSCINEPLIREMAGDIVKQGCDLVLVPGDLVNGFWMNCSTPYETQFENWKRAMKPLYDAGIGVYPVRGNHENGVEYYRSVDKNGKPYISEAPWPPAGPLSFLSEPALKQAFQSAFNYTPNNGPDDEKQLTYSFNHKNAFFVALDEYIDLHKVNQTWLDGQLANNTKPHIFVYGHDPAFKVVHNDSLAYYPVKRDAFWNSIVKAGARIYFCGHDHLYNRARVLDDSGKDLYQIVIGSCGAPQYTWKPPYAEGPKLIPEYNDSSHYGYILVTIDGNNATVMWRAITPQLGELSKTSTAAKLGAAPTGWMTLDSFKYSVE
jgi:hypothetical protein